MKYTYSVRHRGKKGNIPLYSIERSCYIEKKRHRKSKQLPLGTSKQQALEICQQCSLKENYAYMLFDLQQITFTEYVEKHFIHEYINTSNLAPSTMRSHLNIIRGVGGLDEFFGWHNLTSINPKLCQEYIQTLIDKGTSIKTIKNKMSVLSVILSEAKRQEYLPIEYVNPVTLIRYPRKEDKAKYQTESYTLEEVCSMTKQALNDNNYIVMGIIALGCYSGLRRSEMLGLMWQDLKMQDKLYESATIKRTVTVTTGESTVIREEGKTESSLRTVPLAKITSEILTKMKRLQSIERMKCGTEWDGDDFIFTMPATYNGRLVTPSYIYKRFRKFTKKYGYRNLRLHSTRATYATLSLESGVPVEVVSKNLGHTTIGMTYNHYVALSEEYKAKESSKLNDNLQKEMNKIS